MTHPLNYSMELVASDKSYMCRIAVLLVVSLLSLAAEISDGWYHEVRPLYSGIPVQVRFAPANQRLADEVWRYLESIDGDFNDYRDDSVVGRINLAGISTHQLSPAVAEAFATASHLNALTEGAFDITVGPLRRAWREASKSGHLPSAEQLATLRASVGPDTWRIVDGTVQVLKPGVRFDFGGLIKGMSVDHAMRLLVDAGVHSALVQSSGETGCFGLSPRGKLHVLGIPHPDAPDEKMWCTIGDQGNGFSGSTSGNYRRAITIEGRPYYHIFDPRTAQPVDTHTLSISVAFPIGFRNGLADGLTKVGAVLGWEKLCPLVESLGGQALVLIRKPDGGIEEHASSGWTRLLVRSHEALEKPNALSAPAITLPKVIQP